jgi:hypothetical protein
MDSHDQYTNRLVEYVMSWTLVARQDEDLLARPETSGDPEDRRR